MSYGKDDFLHWDDDIDLDSLLGEYTCSELEISDDDEHMTKKSKPEKASASVIKTYKCSDCDNSYASISGLRGHLRKKHGITNVKGMLFNMICFLFPILILSMYVSPRFPNPLCSV